KVSASIRFSFNITIHHKQKPREGKSRGITLITTWPELARGVSRVKSRQRLALFKGISPESIEKLLVIVLCDNNIFCDNALLFGQKSCEVDLTPVDRHSHYSIIPKTIKDYLLIHCEFFTVAVLQRNMLYIPSVSFETDPALAAVGDQLKPHRSFRHWRRNR